jgi:DNA polymerase
MKIIKPDLKISQEHGLWFERMGIQMMAMLHPAALLRNPTQKPEAFKDFLSLREKIKEICINTY